MEKNRGIIVAPPKPHDYILGSTSKIQVFREVADWSIYLPSPEKQYSTFADFDICVTMSGADHSVAAQLNYLLATNQLPSEALNFFHNNHFIVDGEFSLSSRFSAKTNQTDLKKGNTEGNVAQSARDHGFAPEMAWPTHDTMTWNDFYSPVPQKLIDLAKETKWWIDIGYQWVNKTDIPEALKSAPVQIAIALCPGYVSPDTVPACAGAFTHAVMNYKEDGSGDWLIFDHYPPFLKVLAPGYDIPFNLQYIVTVKPILLRLGMQGDNVVALQKDLNRLGYGLATDGLFGPKTVVAVKNFQNKTALASDGIAGPLTLSKLKELGAGMTLVGALIEVESQGNDEAEGDLTLKDHAYGCLQIRQGVCDDVNRYFGTTYRAEDCLGHRSVSLDIFEKYWQVYPTIVTNEDRSRTWNGGPGWKKIYWKTNKTASELLYCKNLDAYWTKVKALL